MHISELFCIFVVVVVVSDCKYNYFYDIGQIADHYFEVLTAKIYIGFNFEVLHLTRCRFIKMKESERADRNVDARAIINAVLNHVGMRAPSFAKAIGINYQRIFDLQSGRTKKFNPGVVNLICAKFPEINKTYLYTGEGSLTLNGVVNEVPVIFPGAGPSSQLAEMLDMQNKLMEMFKSLTDREADLNERLVGMQERERELNNREAELDKREAYIDRILEENGLKKNGDAMGA